MGELIEFEGRAAARTLRRAGNSRPRGDRHHQGFRFVLGSAPTRPEEARDREESWEPAVEALEGVAAAEGTHAGDGAAEGKRPPPGVPELACGRS